MDYGYQDIQRVMKEARVDFEEADKALKKTRGNINEAIIVALRKKKDRGGFFERVIDAFVRLFFYRVRIEKGNKKYMDIALWILAIIAILAEMALRYNTTVFITFVGFMIVLFSGSKLTLEPQMKKVVEREPELVDVKPMEEDEVLQNYPDEQVTEEDGYNSVEV